MLTDEEIKARAVSLPKEATYIYQGRLAPLSKEFYLSLSPEGKSVFRRVKANEKRLAALVREYMAIRDSTLAETSLPGGALPAQENGPQEGLNAEVKVTKAAFDWTPFQAIPNVKKFTVTVGETDSFYEYFGINKKIAPEMVFEPYRNNQFIKYAVHTIKRLRNVKSDLAY